MDEDDDIKSFYAIGWIIAIVLAIIIIVLVYTAGITPAPNDVSGVLANEEVDKFEIIENADCNGASLELGTSETFNFNFDSQDDLYELNGKWRCSQIHGKWLCAQLALKK